jgi:hypothetical protein
MRPPLSSKGRTKLYQPTAKTSATLSIFSCSISAVSVSRMDRISLPVLPCASRVSITDLDIITKKSVVNCVVPSLYSCDRSECYLEVEHIAIDLDHIYLGVIILNTVTSYCIRTQVITEGLIITKVTR